MKRIYLDNAATTKLDNKVKEKMIEVMDFFANPSSMYKEAWESKNILNESRQTVAEILNCESSEVIFTGSGTESDNLAIFAVAHSYKKEGKHIISSKIEHPAVLRAMEQLELEGFEITYLDVKENGIIDLEDFKKALRNDTILVSIMYANNEIGTIQPIKEIAKIIKTRKPGFLVKPIFHTDACQAMNYLNVDVQNLGIDLMTFSGSKIYGPKGVGVLYKKKDIKIKPIIYGGGQEMNFRSGTENIFLIVGLTEALKITQTKKESETKRLLELQNYFIEKLQNEIDGIFLNGDREERLVNNVHISISGAEGESLVLMLDNVGILVATGSACSSKDLSISHVLQALDIPDELAHGSLRFTFGKETTKEDLDYTVQELKKIVDRLRSFSAV